MDLKCAFLLGKYNSTNGWTWYDLEHSTSINTSSGKVRYRKFDGLEKEGEASNIYTESYADSDVLRVSEVGENIHRKSTNLVLDLMFFGDGRNTVKDNLLQILEADGGITVYWDNIGASALSFFSSPLSSLKRMYMWQAFQGASTNLISRALPERRAE